MFIFLMFCFSSHMECNGIAVWSDWYPLNSPRFLISTGPISPITVGEKINWDMYTRQGVYLFSNKCKTNEIKYSFSLNFSNGHINFKCD